MRDSVNILLPEGSKIGGDLASVWLLSNYLCKVPPINHAPAGQLGAIAIERDEPVLDGQLLQRPPTDALGDGLSEARVEGDELADHLAPCAAGGSAAIAPCAAASGAEPAHEALREHAAQGGGDQIARDAEVHEAVDGESGLIDAEIAQRLEDISNRERDKIQNDWGGEVRNE